MQKLYDGTGGVFGGFLGGAALIVLIMSIGGKARNGERALELVRIRVCTKTMDPSQCPPQLHFSYEISLSRFTPKTSSYFPLIILNYHGWQGWVPLTRESIVCDPFDRSLPIFSLCSCVGVWQNDRVDRVADHSLVMSEPSVRVSD